MASSTPRTREDIVQRVLRKLSHPAVKVELTPEQVSDAYDDAVRWFVGRKGQAKYLAVPVVADQQDYTNFPEDLDAVLDVVPARSGIWDLVPWEAAPTFLGFDGFPARSMSYPYQGGYSGLVQELQYYETARRILGGEFTWDWFPDTKVLRIYPKPTESGQMLVQYVPTDVDLLTMGVRDVDLVIRWAVADAKERLGRIRAKFAEWPAAGGTKTLDGDTLLNEAVTEKDALNMEIDSLSYPAAIITR